jgi:cystathionine beta-lyase family protein involved in aluminum resistance
MQNPNINDLLLNVENECVDLFKQISKISFQNQVKILNAFRKNRVSTRHFIPSTGYGYGDDSRDTLYKLYADVFGAEDAIVSPLITSGTHMLSIVFFGSLLPGDRILCITGTPYDTLHKVIKGKNTGSLEDFGITYSEIPLLSNGKFDFTNIKNKLGRLSPKMVFITRSKGYSWRQALSISEIAEACEYIKKISPNTIIFVDNCYGEFVDCKEPTEVGADLIAGSLIKNPGGGIATTGGYVAGKSVLIDRIASRFTSPALKTELGSYNASYLPFYQGLFLAPSVVANALKGSVLFGHCFAKLGYDVNPEINSLPTDIIRAIKFDSKEELITFIQKIQYSSPVDSFVTPIPGAMPGYHNKVIMAAGTFV